MTAGTIEITDEGKAAILNWEAEQKVRMEQREQILTENRIAVFAKLKNARITMVNIEFDGCGDEGSVQSVSAHGAKGEMVIPEIEVDIGHAGYSGTVSRSAMKLANAIEEIVYDILTIHHGGWENNDGAFGELVFDIDGGTISYQHHSRYTEVDTSSYEL
ncbi:MAG: DUF6878 family protein [Pacificimonas sp.]